MQDAKLEQNMPRVAGVDIPNDKPIRVSLCYIYGIGPTNSRIILKEAGIDGQRRAREMSDEDLAKIATIIDRTYLVEGSLRRQVQQNIARLRDIGSYRGMRHRRSLPVRGQRTRSNARTRKGPRKTVAGKKGVKELGK
jgi:small subunit ribosomal protein S13